MKILEYEDTIMFPFASPDFGFMGIRSYSSNPKIVNIPCTIERYHHSADEPLNNCTYKVKIVPIDEGDRQIYGTEQTYFSDISRKIIELNPEYRLLEKRWIGEREIFINHLEKAETTN